MTSKIFGASWSKTQAQASSVKLEFYVFLVH